MKSDILFILPMFAALVSGVAILLYFDEGTLFLATLLLSIVAIKLINKKVTQGENFSTLAGVFSKFAGLWFALSIAPAFGVAYVEMFYFPNGFFIQSSLSLGFFVYLYRTQPSIIGRIQKNVMGGVGVIASSIIAGAAAGILSASLWQVYTYQG